MPHRPHQRQDEAASSSSAACILLDLVALGPVQELIWSGLDTEDRQRLRETCRSLRSVVERSCTALKPRDLLRTGQAESLVKLSKRLPRVQTLQLSTAQALQALSLDPPPSGEQHVRVHGASALLVRPAPHLISTRPPLLPRVAGALIVLIIVPYVCLAFSFLASALSPSSPSQCLSLCYSYRCHGTRLGAGPLLFPLPSSLPAFS
jgi:hypothetical protein